MYLEHGPIMETNLLRGEERPMLTNAGVAAPAADNLIKDATTQSFMKDVIEESRRQPVLVDFWAPWCGPCKQLTPILEKAVRAVKGKIKLVKMNIDEHPAVPGQMGIQSIPAVIAFVNGKPADGFLGALPEGQVIAFLERLTKAIVTHSGNGEEVCLQCGIYLLKRCLVHDVKRAECSFQQRAARRNRNGTGTGGTVPRRFRLGASV